MVNNAGLRYAPHALVDTTVDDWDHLHAVLARGSFLVSREAAPHDDRAAGCGGDIVYVVSKNAIAAGPENVAYGAAKADQAHQVRLLAAELGPHGIRVNGVNPDGVVEGSGHLQRMPGVKLGPRPTASSPSDSASSTPTRTLLGDGGPATPRRRRGRAR